MTERVWERFLTAQDRAHLDRSRPKTPRGFGRRAAVLSVDNYRAAVGDTRLPLVDSIELWPSSTGLAGWLALDSIAILLSAARAAGLPIIHLTALAEEDSGVPGWATRRGTRGAPPRDAAARDRHRRRYDFVEQAAPLPGEVILTKTAPSGFFGTPLMAYLTREGIDTLIVCGETVSGCVRATVVDGCSYRLNMIVVEDCVYDRHETTWAMNLFDIDQKYGDVVSLDDVLTHLGTVVPRPPASSPDTKTHGGPDASAGHHQHHSHQAAPGTVQVPAAVLRALPVGVRPREVCQHPIHGEVLAHGGDEVVAAAREAMVAGFVGHQHAVVVLTAADVAPEDDPAVSEALAMTAGGVLLVGISWDPATDQAAERHQDTVPNGATAAAIDEECPECGAVGAEQVAERSGSEPAVLGCPECGTVWDAAAPR